MNHRKELSLSLTESQYWTGVYGAYDEIIEMIAKTPAEGNSLIEQLESRIDTVEKQLNEVLEIVSKNGKEWEQLKGVLRRANYDE